MWDVLKYVYIKKETYRMAEKIHIPIPKTYYANNLEEALDMDITFPAVIKPSIRPNYYNKIRKKAYKIMNKNELAKIYRSVCKIIDPSEVLIQEFIPGGSKYLYSFCPFFKNGKSIAHITARRARQHPMDFGHASTFAELVNIPKLKEIGEKFLKSINYYGIAEVEFMQDIRDKSYKLLEVNPRVWGWHSLAIAAGIDLPYILYLDMIGKPNSFNSSVSTMKWFRLTTDLPTVFIEMLKGKIKLKDYINSIKGPKEFAVFNKADPIPFLVEILLLPYLWFKKGF